MRTVCSNSRKDRHFYLRHVLQKQKNKLLSYRLSGKKGVLKTSHLSSSPQGWSVLIVDISTTKINRFKDPHCVPINNMFFGSVLLIHLYTKAENHPIQKEKLWQIIRLCTVTKEKILTYISSSIIYG